MQHRRTTNESIRPRQRGLARLAGIGLLALTLAACGATPTATPAPTAPTATTAPAPTVAPPPAPTATKAAPTATVPRPTATATARPTQAPTRAAGPTASTSPIVLSPPSFERAGRQGETIRTLAVGGKDGNILYAGYKGVSRSTDGGKAWVDILFEEEAPLVSAIAVSPGDAATVIVGVNEGCAKGKPHPGLISADGGTNWKKTLTNITSVSFDPKNPKRIYATDCNGAQLSEDGGATWQAIAGAQVAGYTPAILATAPSAPAVMYLVAASEAGVTKIIRTNNLPTNGEAAASTRPAASARPAGTPATGPTLAATTWLEVSPPATVTGPLALTIDPKDPEVALLSATMGLFRTTNGGQTWLQLTDGGLEQTVPTRVPAGTPDGFRLNTALVASLEGAETLWLGTGSAKVKGVGLLRSRDGGTTWKRVSGGLEGRPIQAMALGGTAKARILYVGTDDGIWSLIEP